MDVSLETLNANHLLAALPWLLVLYFIYTQVAIPWRNAHARREERLHKLEQRTELLEKRCGEHVHLQDFEADRNARKATLDSIEHSFEKIDHRFDKLDSRLDNITETLNLRNQAFDVRLAKMEVKTRGGEND